VLEGVKVRVLVPQLLEVAMEIETLIAYNQQVLRVEPEVDAQDPRT
jgi:hypothetical protein